MKNRRGILMISMGLLLIAAAFFITIYNLYDGYRASQSAADVIDHMDSILVEEKNMLPEDNAEIEIPDYILNPGMEMPEENINGQAYIGILEIPFYDLKLPIISQWSYPKLKIAPCRYEGSAYTNNLIIAAHNYNSHFGNIKNLPVGETIIFTDIDGNVFTYEVVVQETLMPAAIEEMSSGEWDLTLFTCTLSGSYRVTIRCELVEDE